MMAEKTFYCGKTTVCFRIASRNNVANFALLGIIRNLFYVCLQINT